MLLGCIHYSRSIPGYTPLQVSLCTGKKALAEPGHSQHYTVIKPVPLMNLSQYIDTPLPQMLRVIQKAEAPEAVFLLGRREARLQHHNLFFPVSYGTGMPHSFFLVLVVATDSKTCTAMQSRLECLLQPGADTTVWCIPLTIFNEKLTEGDYFASTLVKDGERLHYAKNAEIIAAAKSSPLFPAYTSLWYGRALEFYAGAELYIIRKQSALAAFHLHQCAEQALTSIIVNKSGYRPSTHNIALLYRYAGWFEPELLPLFSTDHEKELLQMLQTAYTGSRYDKDYSIKTKTLEEGKEKIDAILKRAYRPVKSRAASAVHHL